MSWKKGGKEHVEEEASMAFFFFFKLQATKGIFFTRFESMNESSKTLEHRAKLAIVLAKARHKLGELQAWRGHHTKQGSSPPKMCIFEGGSIESG